MNPPPKQLVTLLMQTQWLYARKTVGTSVSVAADISFMKLDAAYV
jgi:hypothetical protein